VIVAALAFAYGVTATAVARLVGRYIRVGEQHEHQPQPWTCPNTVADLEAELIR
jgi:hypothetical protein